MKFNIQSKELARICSSMMQIIPSKASLPCLSCFVFSVTGNDLNVTASDIDILVRKRAVVEGAEDGSMMVDARKFTEIVKSLSDGVIEVCTNGKLAEVKWSSGHSKIPFENTDEYPVPQEIPSNAVTSSFPTDKLLHALNRCIPCMGTDDLRPIMNGVYFDNKGEHFNLVGTNANILNVTETPVIGTSDMDPFVLASKASRFLRSELDTSSQEAIGIINAGSWIHIIMDSINIIARKVEGKFPNYESIFPKSSDYTFETDCEMLLSAVKGVSCCASSASNNVIMDFSSGQVMITAEDLEFSTAAREKVEGEYYGADLKLGLNVVFLMAILSSHSAQKVKMGMNGSNKGVLFTGDEVTSSIQMPVRL